MFVELPYLGSRPELSGSTERGSRARGLAHACYSTPAASAPLSRQRRQGPAGPRRPGAVSAPSPRPLSEKTHSAAHTAAARSGSPRASAPFRAGPEPPRPAAAAERQASRDLRRLPCSLPPPPASGSPPIGRGAGRGQAPPRSAPRPALKLLLGGSELSRGFPGTTGGLEAEERLGAALRFRRAEAGLLRAAASVLLWGSSQAVLAILPNGPNWRPSLKAFPPPIH